MKGLNRRLRAGARHFFFASVLLIQPQIGLAESPVEPSAGKTPELCRLVSDSNHGRKALPIIIPVSSRREVELLADQLARILGRMAGVEFTVVRKKDGPGIILGTRKDYPEILADLALPKEPEERERYRVLTSESSLWIIGETELGLQNGVFGFLASQGYRQYYPSDLWEIIPSKPDISVLMDVTDQPKFKTRSFFQNNALAHRVAFEDWKKKNRAIAAFEISTVGLLRPTGKALKEHPEWFTTNREPKPIVESEGLTEVLLEDALLRIAKSPGLQSLGLSPTDGGGWPDSKLGTPSDRMVYMANSLLSGLRVQGKDTKIAFLAYHMQSPPPEISLVPGAVVLVATSYSKGGFTTEQLLEGWRKKGAEVGIYEYLDNGKLTLNLPGRAAATDLRYVRDSIRDFYSAGARYWMGEAGCSWVPNGLAYYLVAQTLWNPDAAITPEALLDEFVTNCFGVAKGPMRNFYTLIAKESRSFLSEDLLARLYSNLEEALEMEVDPTIRQRILQVGVYARYVELMYEYRGSSGASKAETLRKLANLTFGRREDVPAFAWQSVTRQLTGSAYQAEKDAFRKGPHSKMKTPLITTGDLESAIKQGVQRNKRLEFKPVTFSEQLVPFARDTSYSAAQELNEVRVSKEQNLIWFAPHDGAELQLQLCGGWRPIGQKLPIKVSITPFNDPLADVEGADASVDKGSVPTDQNWHTRTLRAKEAGLHFLTIDDGFNETKVKWPQGEKIVIPSGMETQTYLRSNYDVVFFVPAKAERVAGYSETNKGKLLSENGQVLLNFESIRAPGYFDVKIAPANRNRIFRIEMATGKKLLMTVPPFLARSAQELLVPEECLKEVDDATQ